jgi:hypothetical protein
LVRHVAALVRHVAALVRHVAALVRHVAALVRHVAALVRRVTACVRSGVEPNCSLESDPNVSHLLGSARESIRPVHQGHFSRQRH